MTAAAERIKGVVCAVAGTQMRDANGGQHEHHAAITDDSSVNAGTCAVRHRSLKKMPTSGPGPAMVATRAPFKFTREVTMRNVLISSMTAFVLTLAVGTADDAMAQQAKPIRIGVNTAIQLQVGRDGMDGVKMAIDELNEQGGVLGRKFEMIAADEGEAANEGPKVGIAAINKLTSEDHVDVRIAGYDSGVTLAELPHIARAKTIFLGIGSASPAIQQKVKDDYEHYKYIFRVNPINSARQGQALIRFITGK